MQKLILKFLLLIILVLVVFSFTEDPLTKVNPFHDFVSQFQQSVEEGCDYDLLFYGSSKSYSTFNPRVFSEILAVNSFNFGNNGQRLPTTNFILEQTLQYQKPDLIVVELYDQSLRSPSSKKNISFQFNSYDAFDISINKLEHTIREFPLNELPYLYIKTLRNHTGWKSIDENKIDPQNTIYLKEEINGYRGWQYVIKDPQQYTLLTPEQNVGHVDKYQLDSDQMKNIEKLLAISREHEIQVLFVTAPSIRDLTNPNYSSFSASLTKYLEGKNQDYIDLNLKIDSIGLDPYDFRDDIHLNHKGASKVSAYFAKWINRNYGLGILNTVEAKVQRHITEGFYSKSSTSIGRKLTDKVLLKRIDYINTGKDKMSVIMELQGGADSILLDEYTIMFHAHPDDNYAEFLSDRSKDMGRSYEIWDFHPQIMHINNSQYIIYTVDTKIQALKTANIGIYSAKGYNGLLFDIISIKF